jgi:hypothetical protein
MLFLLPALVAGACLLLLALGCAMEVPIPAERVPIPGDGGFVLAIDRAAGHLAILRPDGTPVIASFGRRPFVQVGWTELRGGDGWETDRMRVLDAASDADRGITLRMRLESPRGGVDVEGVIRQVGPAQVRIALTPDEAVLFDHISIQIASTPDEAFLGGGNPPRVNLKGHADAIPRVGKTGIPFVLSSRGYGLAKATDPSCFFDFRSDFRTTLEVWGEPATIDLYIDPSPKKTLERFTANVGRPPVLQDWVYGGIWLTARGGPERIREVATKARSLDLPVTAVLAPDWPGDLRPLTDGERAMLSEMNRLGVRVVGSMQGDDRADHGLIDGALGAGLSGWIAVGAHDNPTPWTDTSRRALADWGVLGSRIILNRSGSLGTLRHMMLADLGDRAITWTGKGGMAATIAESLSLGASGVPLVQAGAGGWEIPRFGLGNRELFMRWTELGACSLVFRIEDGDRANGRWSYDADPATLAHVRRMVRLHRYIAPVLKDLVAEASATGIPVMRPLAFDDPANPEAWNISTEYQLGDNLLIVPVLKPGARQWEVYFPAGHWKQLLTGRYYRGPSRRTLPARVGEPLIFRRANWRMPAGDPPATW